MPELLDLVVTEFFDVDATQLPGPAENQRSEPPTSPQRSITETRAVEVVVAADANRDGKISLEEFTVLMEGTA